MALALIMKNQLQIFLVFIIVSCSASKVTEDRSNATFHDEIETKLIITSVDRFTLDLYDVYRFQFYKEKGNGVILKLKGDTTIIIENKIIELKLCDVGTFRTIFKENDTTYVGDTPLVYGKQDGLKDNYDTLAYRGHFMLNGVILDSHGEVILDFGNNAIEPVFEICNN